MSDCRVPMPVYDRAALDAAASLDNQVKEALKSESSWIPPEIRRLLESQPDMGIEVGIDYEGLYKLACVRIAEQQETLNAFGQVINTLLADLKHVREDGWTPPPQGEYKAWLMANFGIEVEQ